MSEITLANGEVVKYDVIMPLYDFKWCTQEVCESAYIDGYEIHVDNVTPDNLERRWFDIRQISLDINVLRVNHKQQYSHDTPVYVNFFDDEICMSLINYKYQLMTKYENQESAT